MLNRHPMIRRAALGLAPALLVATGLTAAAIPPAAADPEPRCSIGSCDDDDGGSEAESGDGSVTIFVWGSGTTGGGEGYEIPGESVTVLPPCRYFNTTWSGKQYYDMVQSGEWVGGRDEDGNPIPPYPGYEAYKDDTEGRWWSGMCSSADYDGPIEDFIEFSNDWFDNEFEPLYVEPGEPVPVPPIPPEVLVQVAYDAMTLPDPQIGWNPRREGDGATFVNLPTWMWLEDGPVTLEVHAEAGANEARVEATMTSMNFSASNAAPVSCDGHGVAWTSGATSDCALTFTRSSAHLPGGITNVLAESEWAIEWFANGVPEGPLDPQTTSATFGLPIAEVQTIVTR
ncbi:hypothetical protein [Jiangella alkaliphila]|uniref:Enoyl reductase n=1 Tax=Jiangella alkaliphila TaxID=419479 RepID=A0A1H2ICY9_9ACTN|nr:hypothetical protein [Jiangella alkaliphila]SDU41718.1 hypothetical protein SAMN04488563_1601 [Jiangella alkaliphila]